MVRLGGLVVAIIVTAAFYFVIYKNTKFQNWISNFGKGGGGGGGTVTTTPSDGGGGKDTGTTSGGGGATAPAGKSPYPTTGKTWQFKDSGSKTRHYASDGSSGTTEWNAEGMGAAANLVGIVYYTHPSSCSGGHGDEADIKMWGPHHSNGGCCWCIMNIAGDGTVCAGGEGPHPKTTKCRTKLGNVGAVKGKTVGLLHAIWKIGSGAHSEVWIDVGGGFKKIGQYEGQCGNNQKSSSPSSGQQVQFRCDCSGVKIQSATVYEITPPSGGGGGSSGGGTTKTPASGGTTKTPAKSTGSKKAGEALATLAYYASVHKANLARIPYIEGVTRLPDFNMSVNGEVKNESMYDFMRYPEGVEDDCGYTEADLHGRIEREWFKSYQSQTLAENIPFSDPIGDPNDYYNHYLRNPERRYKKPIIKLGNLGGWSYKNTWQE